MVKHITIDQGVADRRKARIVAARAIPYDQLCDYLLPAHVSYLLLEVMRKQGMVLRADFMANLNHYCAKLLAPQIKARQVQVGQQVDAAAGEILSGLHYDTVTQVLTGWNMVAVKLAQEGYLPPGEVPVMQALAMLSEAEEHPGDWDYKKEVCEKIASDMHSSAREVGRFGTKWTAGEVDKRN